MPYVKTRDHLRIYFEDHGTGEPIVLSYGIAGSTDDWASNLSELAKNNRVILWEPRGITRSDAPSDPTKYSFNHWVNDLEDLLNSLQIRRAHIGGLSLGGGIAVRFGIRNPRRVRSLIISDSSTAAGTPLSVNEILVRANSMEKASSLGMKAVAQYAIRKNSNIHDHCVRWPKAKEWVYRYHERQEQNGYINVLRATIAMDYISDDLKKLTTPTLLICGAKDPSLKVMRSMKKKMSNSKLVVVPDAGHFCNIDRPDAWSDAVTSFLERLRNRSIA